MSESFVEAGGKVEHVVKESFFLCDVKDAAGETVQYPACNMTYYDQIVP
jgi:hypothetical protein